MDKYTLPVCNTVFSDRTEFQKTFDATLPEYCPGIVRIISTDADAFTENAEFSDGLIKTSGKIIVRMCFISEQNGTVKCVKFPFDFSHTFDAAGLSFSENSEFVTESKAFITSIASKPRNQRSIEIRCTLYVSAAIHEFEEVKLLSNESSPELELHKSQIPVVTRHMFSAVPETVREEIILEETMPAISEITDYSVQLKLDSVSCTEHSANINGTAILKCTYRAEADTETDPAIDYITLNREIPFNDSISCDNIDADSLICGKLIPMETDISTAFDPYGENRIINLQTSYEAVFDILACSNIEYCDDGYCPDFECSLEKTDRTYDDSVYEISENLSFTQSFPADKSAITQITDTFLTLNPTGTEISEGKLCLKGKAFAKISGINDRSEPICIQQGFAVHLPLDSINAPQPDRKYIINAETESCNAELRDGEITLNAVIKVSGFEISRKRISAISNAVISYDSPKPVCRSEFIIYYPEANETVWDIAKKYEAPAGEIMEANNLKNDGLPDTKTIVIPCREV